MIEWDRTISLGTVISIVALVVGVIGLILRQNTLHHDNIRRAAELHTDNVQRFTELKTRVDAMWDWFAAKIERMNGK